MNASVELTRALAEHTAALALDRLPAEVIAKAKLCVLDTLGCAIAGVAHPVVVSLVDALRPALVDDGTGASLWGRGIQTTAPQAVLVNASASHVVNADDAHKESMGHPACVVIPAALVTGEIANASGAAVLEAVVAGYEAVLRIGVGVGVASHRDRGWYATSSLGPFGAAVAAARLLGLDASGVAGALGHAGAQASGLWSFTADGSLANVIYPGRAAELGVLGALLVRNGLPGPTRVLEAADGGFLRAMSDAPAIERILADLGRRFAIMDVSLKPYPCSRSTHAPIDACLAIRGRMGGAPGWTERISRILVRTYPVAKRQADIPDPETEWMSTLSINYTAAVALSEGAVGVEHFTRRYLDDPAIRALMGRVEVIVDPEIAARFPTAWSCRVEVETRDGQREVETVLSARGDPKNPMTQAEVGDKFRTLTRDVVDGEVAKRMCEAVDGLERLPSVVPLVALLRGAGRGAEGTA